MAFTLEERMQLGIHGLIPPCFLSQDIQLLRIMRYYEKQQTDLDKSVPGGYSFRLSPGLRFLWPAEGILYTLQLGEAESLSKKSQTQPCLPKGC